MKVLTYDDIVAILHGAAFLGGGGGGPLDIALNMLKQYKGRSLSLYSLDDISSGESGAVIAAMGDPTKAAGKDFNSILSNTFRNIKEAAANSRITCVTAGECGGFNTFAPIFVALNNPDVKLIDADGSGRAVPGLDTSLLSVRGVPITPFVLTSEMGEWIAINTKSDQSMSSPQKCEEIARFVSTRAFFGDVGGIGGWVMEKSTMADNMVKGGMTKCLNIGRAILKYKNTAVKHSNIFSYLSENASVQCKSVLLNAKLSELGEGNKNSEAGGFAYGVFSGFNKDESAYCHVSYLNEFLVCYRANVKTLNSGDKVIATAPTIITLFDEDKYRVVTDSILKNEAEALKQTRLSLGIVSVADTWGTVDRRACSSAWKKYLKMVGHIGDCVLY